ncbi:MFS transporter [Allokutzneria oryzae]|uniref:MFS transporter n=1 Tax=Allokutzneria oryzae TaxID=1378989 RepID=A0ABV6A732_9PSEU
MALTTGSGTGAAPTRAGHAALAILAVAQFLIALDYSIVYVAMPSIGAELRLTESTVQWVISGYAVFFAGFLIVGGRAADRLGARRLFVGGLLVFGVAALAGGLAQEPTTLLLARAAQGIGAAVLQPAVLALLNTMFAAGPERNRALAVWGTTGASGLAAGVVLGGLLTTFSWRWVFLINLPLAAVCALAAPLLVIAGSAPRKTVPLNVLSAVLCTGTVLALAIALTSAASGGWASTTTLTGLGASLVLLVAFTVRERGSAGPLVDPVLRRTRSLVVGCGAAALYMASVGNEFFLVTLLLQQLRGLTPLQAGIGFLPLALAITAGNMVAGRLVNAFGSRRVLAVAFGIDAAGLLLLALLLHGDSYLADLLPGLIISGLGHGLTFTTMFIAGTRDIADRNQGVGSALMTTAQYISGALGVAVLVLVLGPAPDAGRFMWAVLLTALFAAAGVVLAWFGPRRSPAGDPKGV